MPPPPPPGYRELALRLPADTAARLRRAVDRVADIYQAAYGYPPSQSGVITAAVQAALPHLSDWSSTVPRDARMTRTFRPAGGRVDLPVLLPVDLVDRVDRMARAHRRPAGWTRVGVLAAAAGWTLDRVLADVDGAWTAAWMDGLPVDRRRRRVAAYRRAPARRVATAG